MVCLFNLNLPYCILFQRTEFNHSTNLELSLYVIISKYTVRGGLEFSRVDYQPLTRLF